MYVDGIKLLQKNHNELETLIHVVRIYSQDIGIEFERKKCHANNEKWKTTHDGQNRTTESRKKKRTLGQKETYKYLVILEADTIKQVKMKKTLRKDISVEPESYSRKNIAEPYQRDEYLG